MSIGTILNEILEERERQRQRPNSEREDMQYSPFDWHEMIADYNAWARRMAAMGKFEEARARYIQVAELAISAAEVMNARASMVEEKEKMSEAKRRGEVVINIPAQSGHGGGGTYPAHMDLALREELERTSKKLAALKAAVTALRSAEKALVRGSGHRELATVDAARAEVDRLLKEEL